MENNMKRGQGKRWIANIESLSIETMDCGLSEIILNETKLNSFLVKYLTFLLEDLNRLYTGVFIPSFIWLPGCVSMPFKKSPEVSKLVDKLRTALVNKYNTNIANKFCKPIVDVTSISYSPFDNSINLSAWFPSNYNAWRSLGADLALSEQDILKDYLQICKMVGLSDINFSALVSDASSIMEVESYYLAPRDRDNIRASRVVIPNRFYNDGGQMWANGLAGFLGEVLNFNTVKISSIILDSSFPSTQLKFPYPFSIKISTRLIKLETCVYHRNLKDDEIHLDSLPIKVTVDPICGIKVVAINPISTARDCNINVEIERAYISDEHSEFLINKGPKSEPSIDEELVTELKKALDEPENPAFVKFKALSELLADEAISDKEFVASIESIQILRGFFSWLLAAEDVQLLSSPISFTEQDQYKVTFENGLDGKSWFVVRLLDDTILYVYIWVNI